MGCMEELEHQLGRAVKQQETGNLHAVIAVSSSINRKLEELSGNDAAKAVSSYDKRPFDLEGFQKVPQIQSRVSCENLLLRSGRVSS